ncbi:hypothetical protein [Novosphingobium sp. KA1]|uniref:hypothetical protein n=1 Tax=Novosphingobium sp. (strain KA1) TaxID=164608 RepID=UPI001A90902F|nr:hypothetical protein [Novosphingobium sp. KA1]QSR16051.1 hypothetical protein CA833_02370 [Novosphingobium sp. KA1]
MAAEISVTWWQVLSLVAGSSFLTTTFSLAVKWLGDRRKRKTDREFSTIYLVASLEAYANDLSNAISDSENYQGSRGEAGQWVGNVPEFPDLPETIDWRALGPDVTREMLDFPVAVNGIRGMIAAFSDSPHNDEDDEVSPLVREKAALLGLRALQIAASLQGNPTGEAISLDDGDWDLKDWLTDTHNRYLTKRLVHQAAMARTADDMNALIAQATDVA